MTGLPLVLDLTGRRVVLVGGGRVAARRGRELADHGAEIVVVAPELADATRELVESCRAGWVAREYDGPADLRGAWLVHTATGAAGVDTRVAADADGLGIWCCDATDARTTRVSVPARTTVATGGGRVTVATYAGGDPRLSVRVRDAVESALVAVDLGRRRARRAVGATPLSALKKESA